MATIDKHYVDGFKSDEESDMIYSSIEENQVRKKIDKRCIPLALVMFIFAYLDRVNIGNARAYSLNPKTGIGQMELDNGMNGNDYNMILSMFFIPFCALEPFTNFAIIYFKPSTCMSRIMITWGILSTCMAACNSFWSMMTVRVLLGAAEAGLFPGLAFWLTYWYKPNEISGRISFFQAGGALSCAFSGLLATSIFYIDGIGNLPAWRWIFILEGIPTIIIGVLVWLIMPDHPETATFFNDRERYIAVTRLQVDPAHRKSKKFNYEEIFPTIMNWQLWAQCLVYICVNTPSSAVAYFQPSILTNLGYVGVSAQWMTIPVAISFALYLVIIANVSDYFHDRSSFLIVGLLIAGSGFIGMVFSEIPSLSYAMLFILSGNGAGAALINGWVANNHRTQTSRGLAIGLLNGIGSIGGAVGGQIYRASDAPRYVNGNMVLAIIYIGGAFLAILIRISFIFKNCKIAEQCAEIRKSGRELTNEEAWKYSL